jgi:nucleotide-binding universal stress UspA family protein
MPLDAGSSGPIGLTMSSSAPSGEARGPALLCYDGSDEAAEAMVPAAALLRGEAAIVLTVWKPIREAILAVAVGPAPLISDPADIDERQQRAAISIARDGARRAERLGLKAEPLSVKASGPIWEEISRVAEARDARLIVCGTHRAGLTTLLDSVPTGLVHHATRPVMVVPSSESVEERREDLDDD